MTEQTSNFEIKLPQFEGPFDLLLFFIERDELDIYDIPIASITNDFLQYIHQLTVMNIEVASEFILVAATLMRIKAKMLLPRPELDEAGNVVDPRQDLVQKLIEYRKYKSVISELSQLEDERMAMQHRGNIVDELKKIAATAAPGEELQTLDLYKLLVVYEKVLYRLKNQTVDAKHVVVQYPYSIEVEKEEVLNLIRRNKKIDFEQVLARCQDKVQLVYSFLAVLEMLQQQMIDITIGEGFNNFWLAEKENSDTV